MVLKKNNSSFSCALIRIDRTGEGGINEEWDREQMTSYLPMFALTGLGNFSESTIDYVYKKRKQRNDN